ncbi:MAG: FHA domain-containing protein [bacterium]
MSKLMHQRSGRTHLLAPTNVVGRSPTSDLSLPFTAAAVSRFHALIYWAEGQEERGWWVRDLNSRNGTFVDGKHILPGRDVKLAESGTVAFGARNDTWMLQVADSPPLILIGRRPDHEVRLIGRAFLLPHDDIPEVMIQRRRGTWVFSTIEAPEDERPLDADRPFVVGETEEPSSRRLRRPTRCPEAS